MADTHFIIPLTPRPQSFSITLAGKEYRMTVRWFDAVEGGWHLDIDLAGKSAPLIRAIPLVAGCNLLEPFDYLNFGGELRISSDTPPEWGNLGSDVKLLYIKKT